ncbi:7953_t:CDS:2 [Acaulospora morrowiae]|uniref:7953_t:CDS:1 n=1 Tax=Acaulospora morrowiae TaxID=94023 RepID=A0A9N8ZQC4_9GLOM|nr:7953_t:CDS:2 [Acaulospora morrowiae]
MEISFIQPLTPQGKTQWCDSKTLMAVRILQENGQPTRINILRICAALNEQ